MPKLPVPDDFPEIAPSLTLRELCERYHCTEKVVRRWSHETGAYASNARGSYNTQTKADRDHEIEACLRCPYDHCINNCQLVKKMKRP